ncbi:Oxysterol-binding protein [Xylariaceae sp. FL0804]|nr:Oxysterol-binding protein [Xylariaceae sp. FL0804]
MTGSQSNLSQLKDFLSYLATVKGDLSNITAPPFVLAPKSVTEIPAAWAERHELFLAPARTDDDDNDNGNDGPAQRALLVLENFLCSLKRQVYHASSSSSSGSASSSSSSPSSSSSSLDENDGHGDGDGSNDDGGGAAAAAAKKPLNAFLGELFVGSFAGRDGSTTRLVCEQVSHHPPVTACALWNATHGMSSSGYVAQETTFGTSSGVRVRQVGHAIVRDDRHAESHLMTLPTLRVPIGLGGLLAGRFRPEVRLEGTCYVVSSSGFLATVTFDGSDGGGGGGGGGGLGLGSLGLGGKKKSRGKGKGGGRNGVRAELRDIRADKPRYEITGSWSGRLFVRDLLRGDHQQPREIVVDDVPLAPLVVGAGHPDPDPASSSSGQQSQSQSRSSPWESRRAWAATTDALRAGDAAAAARAKGALEAAQRDLRAAEEAAGVEWPRLFFRKYDPCSSSSSSRNSNGGSGNEKDEGQSQQGGLEDEFDVLARAIPDPAAVREARGGGDRTAGAWAFVGAGVAERILDEGVFHRGLEPTGQGSGGMGVGVGGGGNSGNMGH